MPYLVKRGVTVIHGPPPETVTGRYSHRRRTETKLTKADEAAAGIHYCNGALQSSKKAHHKSDGNRFKKVFKLLLNHDVTRKIPAFQILNFQNFFKNFFH